MPVPADGEDAAVRSSGPPSSVGPSPILKGGSGWYQSPSSGALKAVSIAEPDSISPLMRGRRKEVPPEQDGEYFNLDRTASQTSLPKQHRANVGGSRRLSGRPSVEALQKPSSQRGHTRYPSSGISGGSAVQTETPAESGYESTASVSTRRGSRAYSQSHQSLFNQVTAWIRQERARRHQRKQRAHDHDPPVGGDDENEKANRGSFSSSDGSTALEKLQEILEKSMVISSNRHHGPRRTRSVRRLRRQSSSDTDYFDGDIVVPHTDAFLDNSATMPQTLSSTDLKPLGDKIQRPPLLRTVSSSRDKDAWRQFKFEIVRLTHTLRLKGWRRVPMELSSKIGVERLSGALTNAVYVVSPPKDLPPRTPEHGTADSTESAHLPIPRTPPPKLLLRIYGSQVDHLIDRTSELAILRRLAKKHIGPRLLGTFTNGRFEEFFQAITLTARDLRDPDISQQIAKRMRELHEGIELLREERDGGPFVWRNIDKWTDRCSRIVAWLDEQVMDLAKSSNTEPRFVCGTPWHQFFDTLNKYRKWLSEQYNGESAIRAALVFAHNDAQYGNILRLTPSGTSPLLMPSNAHKRLVVIDFEYANANLPALEFANHFTEWCYNYHDLDRPWHCSTRMYPSRQEQERFVRAYLLHSPHFKVDGGKSEPNTPGLSGRESEPHSPILGPTTGSVSSSLISSFMLDARLPLVTHAQQQREASNPTGKHNAVSKPGLPGDRTLKSADVSTLLALQRAQHELEAQEDEAREALINAEIQRLLHETRLWRLVNSAQWIMWGVMQAKIPDMPPSVADDDDAQRTPITHEPESCSDADDEAASTATPHDNTPTPVAETPQSEPAPSTGAHNGQAADAEQQPDAEEPADEPEFDYLAYARDRAMFFWADAVGLGIVARDELPGDLAAGIKVVDY